MMMTPSLFLDIWVVRGMYSVDAVVIRKSKGRDPENAAVIEKKIWRDSENRVAK